MNKQTATITVIGKDKTGVIAKVTATLFDHQANIEALEEQVTRGQFSMSIVASWPTAKWDEGKLAKSLKSISRELNMEIRLRPQHTGKKQRMAIKGPRTAVFRKASSRRRLGHAESRTGRCDRQSQRP